MGMAVQDRCIICESKSRLAWTITYVEALTLRTDNGIGGPSTISRFPCCTPCKDEHSPTTAEAAP